MLIKFHGGSRTGAGAAEYLLDFFDHRGRARPGLEVLRGNPKMVGNVIDSLPFKHRFTSAVIAWAPDDKPTPEQIDKVLDSFEQHAWAGLEQDRYAWAAVRHDSHAGDGDGMEKGVHVHILTARVDLESGKSLNIAMPGWQKYFITWCNVINNEYGWARPDDPKRRVPIQLGHGAGPVAQTKERITQDLLARIEAGDINNRQDVLNALRHYGEIARTGKEYVSITPHEGGRNLRLRGVIYEENFNGEAYRQRREQSDNVLSGERNARPEDQRMKSALSFYKRRRAQRHQIRYSPSASPPVSPSEPELSGPGLVGLPEFHFQPPAPTPRAGTSNRGKNDDRNREHVSQRAAGASRGAGRNEAAVRAFDEAVAQFKSGSARLKAASAELKAILDQFIIEFIKAKIQRKEAKQIRVPGRDLPPPKPRM